MTSPGWHHRYTYQDYVWLEDESSTRHEFLDGEIFAMAGGTPEHAAMAAEVIRQLGDALVGRHCRVFTSDLGVRVMATGLATYPDASVVCGAAARDPEKKTNITNPRVLVEVTSDSTEDYDRGEKAERYKQLESLETLVLISHREPLVEIWSGSPGTSEWRRTVAGPGQHARIESLDCALDVDAIRTAGTEV